jgi:hypothetical protein
MPEAIMALPPGYMATPRARINRGQTKVKSMGCSASVGVKADSGSGSQEFLPFVAINMLKAVQHPLHIQDVFKTIAGFF